VRIVARWLDPRHRRHGVPGTGIGACFVRAARQFQPVRPRIASGAPRRVLFLTTVLNRVVQNQITKTPLLRYFGQKSANFHLPTAEFVKNAVGSAGTEIIRQ
jgi:hypothetical protein